MATDRFLIAPINSGLETNLKPFLIMDDAFSRLENAYVFRGRLRKRFGTTLMDNTSNPLNSRLRINLGNLGASPSTLNLPAGATQLAIGQIFSIGSNIFTVYQLGPGVATLTTNGSITATINSTVNPNTVTFTGGTPGTAVFWYPALPVMGLIQYETNNINNEPTYAFDTKFAYQYTGGAWSRLGTAVWTSTNSQFMWGSTYRGIFIFEKYLFVTNNNTTDNIKYWDGATWTTIAPVFDAAGNNIRAALIVVPFQNYLLLMNTTENIGGTNRVFVNRVRYSQQGDPTAADAFRADIPGKGGRIDNTSTQEAIISCEFIKNRLIVFFERSTWELVYTSNQVQPFIWQQINTELGAESTFSVVPFDKVALAIGDVGVHACNGSNVERIDQKIPDSVFQIHNGNEGPQRVYGIRDYYTEMVYWTFPSEVATTYPNRVLVYNYQNGSWAFNNDTFTVFGYFQQQPNLTWATATQTWAQANQAWNAGTNQSNTRTILAGNQEGFVLQIDTDTPRNAPSLQITNITKVLLADPIVLTVIEHNLIAGDYIYIENIPALTGFSGLNGTIYQVVSVTATTITIIDGGIPGGEVYVGGGTIARVSNINIYTKQYNPYDKLGRNVYLSKVDFLVDRTENGQLTVDYFSSSSTVSSLTDGFTVIQGDGVLDTTPYALYPLEKYQDRLWHTSYLSGEGECIQLRIYMSDDAVLLPDETQIRNSEIAFSEFELNAFILHTQPTSSRLQ